MRCNPWRWLWGLIPVAILAFLTVQWEHERIETDLRQRSETALQSAGLDWAVTAFDGRDGLVTGQASSDDAPVRALNVVRSVWGVRVSDQRTHLLQKIDPYVWSALNRDARLALTGYVPTDEARSKVLALAKSAFPGHKIEDRLELARGSPELDTWLGGVGFGLKQLAALKAGSLSLKNTGLTLEGEAADIARYNGVKGALKSGIPAGVTLVAENVTAPVVKPYRWAVKRSGNQVQLDGFVTDDSLREQVFAHAKKTFPRLAIVDRLELAQGAPSGLAGVARAAIEQLARLDEGEVTVSDTQVKIAGKAPDQATAETAAKTMRAAASGYTVADAITYPKPLPPPVSPYVIKIEHDGGVIRLGGHVPSEEARQQVIAATRKRFPERDVRDALQIASGEPPRWLNCYEAGIGALAQLPSGSFTITDAKAVLEGVAREEGQVEKVPADLRTAANRSCETSATLAFNAPPEPDLTWRAAWDGDKVLVIEGDVIDARTRAALVQSATRYFPNAQIQDRMSIADGRSVKWPQSAELGLKMLALLRKGEAVLTRQELLVRGEAKDSAVQSSVRDQLQRSIPKGYSARDVIDVRSDAMIWAEQEAKRKAAEQQAKEKAAADAEARKKAEQDANRSNEVKLRKEEASACQRIMREVATTGIIRFEWASDALDSASRPTLDKLAAIAKACPKARIVIEGHTDAEGTPERNKNLSERRAKSVFDYLARAGVGAERLSAVGYGETQPIAPNDTAANRARNRRIEFTVEAE